MDYDRAYVTNRNIMEVTWECIRGCRRTVTDKFYQHMLQKAHHPPVCICQHTGFLDRPWSRWKKRDSMPELTDSPRTNPTESAHQEVAR